MTDASLRAEQQEELVVAAESFLHLSLADHAPAPAPSPARTAAVTTTTPAPSAAVLRRSNSLQELYSDHDDFSTDDESFHMRPASIASSSFDASRAGVQLEHSGASRSQMACNAYIPAYHPVGTRTAGYVVFECVITKSEGGEIRVMKRYSSFVALRNDLRKQFADLRSAIPALPPKSATAKFRGAFLEQRRKRLSFWLASVILHPILGASTTVKEWILA